MSSPYKLTGIRWRRQGRFLCDVCHDARVYTSATWRRDIFVVKYPDRPYYGSYLCDAHAKVAKDRESQEKNGE